MTDPFGPISFACRVGRAHGIKTIGGSIILTTGYITAGCFLISTIGALPEWIRWIYVGLTVLGVLLIGFTYAKMRKAP